MGPLREVDRARNQALFLEALDADINEAAAKEWYDRWNRLWKKRDNLIYSFDEYGRVEIKEV